VKEKPAMHVVLRPTRDRWEEREYQYKLLNGLLEEHEMDEKDRAKGDAYGNEYDEEIE
jgi:hypothetical protein